MNAESASPGRARISTALASIATARTQEMSSPADDVVALERELLAPSTRRDGARLNELLHPEFVEVGASGRRWTRAEMVEALVADPASGEVEVDDVVASVVSDDVVLVTSTSCRGTASSHRASLWVRRGGSWAVRHHQGTPVAE